MAQVALPTLDINLKSLYFKTMDIAVILDSLAAILVVLTVIGFGVVGVYLCYKEDKRRKKNGINR